MMASTATFFAKSGTGRAEMHLAHDIVSEQGEEEDNEGGNEAEKAAMLYSDSFSHSTSPSDTES